MSDLYKEQQPMLLQLIDLLRQSVKQYSHAHLEEKKVVWISYGMLGVYFYAFGIVPYFPQLFMYNTEEFLKNAGILEGRYGVSTDICSEVKIVMARSLSPETSSRVVPDPNLAISINMFCTQLVSGLDFVGKHKGIPHYTINVPFMDDCREKGRSMNEVSFFQYLSGQYEALTQQIERDLGVAFNEQQFKKAIKCYFKTELLFEQIYKLNENRCAPIDAQYMTGYASPALITNYLIEKNENKILDFYISLYNTLYLDVLKNKKSFEPRDKIRLYWDGHVFFHQRKLLNEILACYGAKIVAGTSVAPYFSLDKSWLDDLDGPLTKEKLEKYYNESRFLKDRFYIENIDALSSADLLARISFKHGCFKRGPKQRLEVAKNIIEQFDIDGTIIHMNQNCRFWSLSQSQLSQYLTNDLGVPCLTIQADYLDPRVISEAQIITRIESFLEGF